MPDHDPLLTDDLVNVAQTLKRQRPRLDDHELDGLKRRAMRASRTATQTNAHKGTFMRSRTAITTLLASGLILSGGGTAIGVTALQATNDAGTAQYGAPGPTGAGQVLDTTNSGGTNPAPAGNGSTPAKGDSAPAGGGGVLGDSAGGGTSPNAGRVQAARQVGTVSSGSLPFTGFAAIPVLLLGLALLFAGLVLRRSSVKG